MLSARGDENEKVKYLELVADNFLTKPFSIAELMARINAALRHLKAAKACPRKLLRQGTPYEPPMPHPSVCKACGDCVRAYPRKAIRI